MDKSEFVEVFSLAYDILEESGLSVELAGNLAVDLYRRGWRKPSPEKGSFSLRSFYSDELIDKCIEVNREIAEHYLSELQAKKNKEEASDGG